MTLCGWIVFGFFAGLLARALMPGEQKMGLIKTTALGVGGSFVGGLVSAFVFHGGNMNRFEPSAFIGSIIGAILLLVIGRAMSKHP
jgi:uncharacterized membrane protein YeaQ/YmgE (transglycosylase-associated protein family)